MPLRPLSLSIPGPSTYARRQLSTTPTRSARTQGHYEALKLPRNATKQQIKAKFYELSKKHHPDAPGGSADRFVLINDAYGVLGDDGRRRQYDRSTSPSASTSSASYPASTYGSYSRTSPSGPHRSWSTRPPPPRNAPPPPPGFEYSPFGRRTPPNFGGGTSTGYGHAPGFQPNSSNPFASMRTDPMGEAMRRGASAFGRRPSETDGYEAQAGSFVWRFVGVSVMMAVVLLAGGGLTASSADEGRNEEGGEVDVWARDGRVRAVEKRSDSVGSQRFDGEPIRQ